MRKDKILYKNKWVELRELIYPEKGINGYTYLHESRCNGKIVSILPYRINNGRIQFYLRSEYTPSWSVDVNFVSSVTGGVDDGDIPVKTAIKEMKEETGYSIEVKHLINLGESKGAKSSDTTYYLFGANITGLSKGETEPEDLESEAHMFWADTIDEAMDPLLYVLYYRLLKHLLSTSFFPNSTK